MARDALTLDMFRDYQPTAVVERFPEDVVRAGTMAAKLSRAVAATLDSDDRPRTEIARAISEFTGEELSRSMLDKYASQGAEHTISAVRLVALVAVTHDVRVLNALLEAAGLIAVPKRFEALLKRELARELQARIEREALAADAEWKAQR